jgi:4-amino-4-deoxy-L-arabinose transferase-like glycosyltransferase
LDGQGRLPWFLLGVLVLLLFAERSGSWLVDPDETRYAAIPQEMVLRGDYVTPYLNGTRYFEKPPLLYWLNAVSLKRLGHSPYAARLAVRLSTLAIVVMLIGLWPRERTKPLDPWPGIIYLTTPLGFILGRFNIIDGLLTAALTLTFICLYRFFVDVERGRSGTGMALGSAMGMALAVLAKGLIGLLLPGLVFVIWITFMNRGGHLWRWLKTGAPLLFLIIAAPWFIAVGLRNPGFAYFFFIREHVLRFTTMAASRPGPIYYFVGVFLAGFLPWSLLFGPALWRRIPWKLNQWREHPQECFLAIWFLVIFAFFSISKSKLIPYILPACPAAALLLAKALSTREEWPNGGRWLYAGVMSIVIPAGLILGNRGGVLARYELNRFALCGGLVLLTGAWATALIPRFRSGIIMTCLSWAGLYGLVIFVLPRISTDLSVQPLAITANQQGAQVVFYQCFSQSLPWELRHPVPLAGDHYDELQIEWGKPESLFWSEKYFWQHWNTDERIVVLLKKEWRDQFSSVRRKTPRELGKNNHYELLSNFDPS